MPPSLIDECNPKTLYKATICINDIIAYTAAFVNKNRKNVTTPLRVKWQKKGDLFLHFSADCDILNIEEWTPRIPEGGNNANKIKEDVLPAA